MELLRGLSSPLALLVVLALNGCQSSPRDRGKPKDPAGATSPKRPVIGFGLIYATTGRFFIRPRIWGKACTLVQLVMIAFCLLAPDLPPVCRRLWPALYLLASGLAIVALVDYFRVGNRFAAQHSTKAEVS